MKAFLLSLFSGDESEVDSVIVCGAIALLALVGVTIYVTIMVPSSFSPMNFGPAAAAVIGAAAGSKRVRDGARLDDPETK